MRLPQRPSLVRLRSLVLRLSPLQLRSLVLRPSLLRAPKLPLPRRRPPVVTALLRHRVLELRVRRVPALVRVPLARARAITPTHPVRECPVPVAPVVRALVRVKAAPVPVRVAMSVPHVVVLPVPVAPAVLVPVAHPARADAQAVTARIRE